MTPSIKTPLLAAAVLAVASNAQATTIIGIFEFGLGGDTPATINNNFNEDVLTYSDRTHQHNGAAFDATTGALSTSGTNIVPLPIYLTGNHHVQFANNARENVGYFATVFADGPTSWYLLVDNRLDGPAGNTSSSNTTDPVLGGSLQWIIDGGWVRVDTGISPNGQADYTAIDESGNASGPGAGLNQFFSVYQFPTPTDAVVVRNNGIGGSNMIALVAGAPIPEPSSAMLLALGGLAFLRRRR